MENNNYQAYTRVEQEDANAAAGEPLAVKAKAHSMPGVTVDGGDPIAVYETVSAAVERARSGEGPTLVESMVYRLSAHGNIIAPPGVPLHYPEHEAIEVFGNVEEYEAAKRGDPVPRFRARLVTEGTLTAEEADCDRRVPRGRRSRRPSSSASTARSRRPRGPSTTSTPRRIGETWHASFRTSQAIGEAVHQEMARDDTVLYFGQNLATDRARTRSSRRSARDRVRVTPISETAEIGMAVGAAFAGYRPVVAAVHGRVHARRDGPGRERGAALLRHDRRPGEGADRAPGRLRVHRRLGRPAHGDDLRDVHRRARA